MIMVINLTDLDIFQQAIKCDGAEFTQGWTVEIIFLFHFPSSLLHASLIGGIRIACFLIKKVVEKLHGQELLRRRNDVKGT